MPTQLDYAPAPPMPHRAIFLRTFRWILLGLVIAGGLYWGPGLWRQGTYIYWQRRAMTFSLPVGQVTYSNQPVDAAGLLGKGYKAVAAVVGPHGGPAKVSAGTSAGYSFEPLEKLAEGTIGAYLSNGLAYRRGSISTTVARTGAFLHGRHGDGEPERLVAVVVMERDDDGAGNPVLELNGLCWQAATWSTGSRLQLKSLTTLVLTGLSGHTVRVFAGRPSSSGNAFTLRYEIDGRPGTIDGALDDMDAVILHVRDGPATQAVNRP